MLAVSPEGDAGRAGSHDDENVRRLLRDGLPPAVLLSPGSLVIFPTSEPAGLRDVTRWARLPRVPGSATSRAGLASWPAAG